MGGLHERMEKQGLARLWRSNVLVLVLESFPSCLVVEELFVLDIFLPWRALRFVSRCCEAPEDPKLVQLAESCIIKGVLCTGRSWNEAFANADAQRRQLPCHELRVSFQGKVRQKLGVEEELLKAWLISKLPHVLRAWISWVFSNSSWFVGNLSHY